MRIKKTSNLTQPILAGVLVFVGAFVLSAFTSHSFTPVGDSSALGSEVNVEIEPSLSLAIMDKDPSVSSDAATIDTIAMEVTPTPDGTFISSTAYIQAGTNNATGYSLSFSDTDENTALDYQGTIPAGTGLNTAIPTIAANSTDLTDIELDKWGYAFGGDTVFSPVPALSNALVLVRTSARGADVYPFTAAAKIGTAILAGTYQDSVTFSITANFVPPERTEATISPITTTQVDGGETFIIDTDIDFPADLTGLGDIIVYIYNTPTDKASCTSPSVGNNNGKLKITCTSPARAAGVYNADIELLSHNIVYTTTNTVTYIPSYLQTVQVRYENADGSWGAYSNVINQEYELGSTVSWSRAQDATYQAASVSYTVAEPKTTQVSVWRRDYTVTWNGNGGSSATAYTRNVGQTIGALPTSTRANYVFAGWYNTSAASGGTAATTTTTVTANVTYYARWTTATIANISYMQDMTSAICSNTAAGTTKTLTDSRDSETYTVKKLADGKCWMTQNLRLARAKAVTLTSANSDVSSNFSLPVAPTTTSSWGSYSNASNVNTTHLYNTQNNSYGVYYNWYAATAGTGTYAMASGTASSSICPKGWRLPTGGTSGEFSTLYAANSSNYATFVNNGNWVLSGRHDYSGTISYQGSHGQYWSSTPSSNSNAYTLYVRSSSADPLPNYYKASGLSVRCLAR